MGDSSKEVEVPQYFLCPISLQIMRDPVTAPTGITYDRENIERWLKDAAPPVCPVTKQEFPGGAANLTPNHTLRRLIQAWCVANAANGVDRIPTPKAPIGRAHIMKLMRGLTVPNLQATTLDQLHVIASSKDHRNGLEESGVAKAMVDVIVRCYERKKTTGLEQAVRILNAMWATTAQIEALVKENYGLMDAITWVLNDEMTTTLEIQNVVILLTKEVVKLSSSSLLERLKPEFFSGVVRILSRRGQDFTPGPTKAAMRVLIEVCQYGRNKHRIIEAGAIFELIELELELGLHEVQAQQQQLADRKRLTELGFCLLGHLCTCADGRAQFLAHAGGVAVVSKRMLRVSPTVDDRAVHVLALVCKYSANKEVLQEMVKVGAVSKMCMVLQADCAKYLKDKVREILRMHSHVWNSSPCIQVYLLTRYPMMQF